MTASRAVPRLHILAVLFLSAAVLLTVGCGGSGDDSAARAASEQRSEPSGGDADIVAAGGAASSGTPDPCTLVAPADLQAAWGVEFGEGEPSETTPPFTFKSCGFGQTSNEPPARTLTVQTIGLDGIAEELREQGQTPQTMYEGMRDYADAAEPVDLGDEGYRSGSQVAFISDGVFVTVDAPGASSTEALAGLQQLAEVVAGNL